jgi:hypothetical protein
MVRMGKVTKIPITVATDDATDSKQIGRVEQNHACDPQATKPSATNNRDRARAFTQADVVRAVRGVVKAGLGPIWRVRIEPTGAISIEFGGPAAQNPNQEDGDAALDKWMAKHAHEAQGH